MYATDDVADALEAAREFLVALDARQWVRLVVVTFFLGGVGGNVAAQWPGSWGGGGGPVEGPPPSEIPAEVWLALAAVVAAAVLLGLAFGAVAGVMDFVLIESLREERIEVRRFWSARWRQGLRLFGFRLGVDVLALVLIAGPILLVAAPVLFGVAGPGVVLVGLLLLLPVLFVVPAGAALVKGLTTAFVVPVMILEGGGVLDGWRRFYPTLREQWKEYLGYVVVNFVLVIAAGVILGIATALGAGLVLIPFVPLFAAGVALLGASGIAGVAVLALAGIAYGLVVVAVGAVVKAPVVTVLRYYALFVLGDTQPDLDPIPERRRLVRGRGSE